MSHAQAGWLRFAAGAGAILLGVFACSQPGPGNRPGGSSGSGGGTGAGAGVGGSAPGGTSSVGGTSPVLPEACEASIPGQRLLRRLTQRELQNTHATVFSEAAAALSSPLPADLLDHYLLSNDASTLVMGSQMAAAVLDRAEAIADVVTAEPALSTRFPCAAQADATCATQFIDTFGSALFRRPVAEAERTRYLALFESVSSRSDFATGLKWTLVSLIQSPHAVYRSELGEGGQLTPYEVASELSYNFSASPPSQELVDLALSGALADPATRVSEASKLVNSAGGQQVLHQFFSEWLSYGDANGATRANVPENFNSVRAKMVLETQRFLDDVLFGRAGTIAELLTANYTVLDSDLSAYYGFPGGSGDLLAGGGVEVPRSNGLGVFAQGSVLTTMASVSITSPTRRGLLVLKRLFCEVPPIPEALSTDLARPDIQGNTTRERLENAHLEGACVACHAHFDPLGFPFENFDHIGRFRTHEETAAGSFEIDPTASIEQLGGQLVNNQAELMTSLASNPRVLSCVSDTIARYIYGSAGSCRAKDSRARVAAGETSIVDFVADLAGEPHFISRQ